MVRAEPTNNRTAGIDTQWHTQKVFVGGISFSGIVAYGGHLHLVCAFCDVTI